MWIPAQYHGGVFEKPQIPNYAHQLFDQFDSKNSLFTRIGMTRCTDLLHKKEGPSDKESADHGKVHGVIW